MYCWFEDFFGIDLADYMWGITLVGQDKNQFFGIGLWMLGITLAVVLLFYYVINHPRLNNWWGWLIFLVSNAVINFLVGWQYVKLDWVNGKMAGVLQSSGEAVGSLSVTEGDFLCFGVTNAILSIMWFIIFSFIFKWWSRNTPNAPF